MRRSAMPRERSDSELARCHEGIADPKLREPGEVPVGREKGVDAVIDADGRNARVMHTAARDASVDDEVTKSGEMGR